VPVRSSAAVRIAIGPRMLIHAAPKFIGEAANFDIG
jgi:hypothetical protein